MPTRFTDRVAAGRALSRQLQAYAGRDDVVVMALPRGGVPVAWAIAKALNAPLDVLVVVRLAVAKRPDLTVGALAGGGALFIDRQVVADHGITQPQLEEAIIAASLELIRRRALYVGRRDPVPTEGRTVIVVDDGIVTGASMQAALKALRGAKADWVVVAVPVASPEAQDHIGTVADDFVCLLSPPDYRGAAPCYEDFTPVRDAEVCELLASAAP